MAYISVNMISYGLQGASITAETYTVLKRWGMGIIIGNLASRHSEPREFGVTQAGFHFTTTINNPFKAVFIITVKGSNILLNTYLFLELL